LNGFGTLSAHSDFSGPPTIAQIEREIRWEAAAVEAGIRRYREELADPSKTLADTSPGQRIIRAVMREFVPWLADALWLAGAEVADVPPIDDEPMRRIQDDIWEAMSKEEQATHKKALSEIYGRNARAEGRRYSWIAKLDMATQLVEEPAIWFPYFCDFRGRLYPTVADLSPQGDDAAKGLLMFACGKPLGDTGLFWLCVRAANCWAQDGVDKLSLEDRVKWVDDNFDRILEAAHSPVDGTRWWTEAEEPWSFLATCFELEQVYPDHPSEFVSHLPIPLDGSCNGLQHLAAMGRDVIGAQATNIVPSETRRDIYTEVATIVSRMVTEDAGKGAPLAQQWLGRVTRKVVKRAVMTTPYGVTERGIGRQLLLDRHTDGMDQPAQAANYLKDLIVKALEETIVSAKQIMAWFQEVAEALGEHDIPFRWQTPTGNTIEQSYWDLVMRRVSTLAGTIALYKEQPEAGLRKRKQRLAAAPNVIHSFDAAHLCRTVNACAELGLTSFAMIHDRYAVHAADTEILSHVLRDEFARIYETNWLQEIEDYVRSYAPQVEIPSWRDYVALGDLDLSQVMEATFFFA
jgi:DNA-directed RNA polymerase